MGRPVRHEIEKFANDAFAVARDRILKEHAAKKKKVLAEVRLRHSRGGYLPARTAWGAECVREMILALADAYVEAFTFHRAPSDARAERTLQTEAQKNGSRHHFRHSWRLAVALCQVAHCRRRPRDTLASRD